MVEITINLETIIALDKYGGVIRSLVESGQLDACQAIEVYEEMAQKSYNYNRYELLKFAADVAKITGNRKKQIELYALMGQFNSAHFRGAAYVSLDIGDRESAKKYFEKAGNVGCLPDAEKLYLEDGDVQGAIDLYVRNGCLYTAYQLAKKRNLPNVEELYQNAQAFFQAENSFTGAMILARDKGDVELADKMYDSQLTMLIESYKFREAKNFAKDYGQEEDVKRKIEEIEARDPKFMDRYIERWANSPEIKEHTQLLNDLGNYL